MKIKKIFCFGDSITGTCVTGYDYYLGLKFYPYLLGEYFDCKIKNYGEGNNSNEKIGIDILNVLQKENIDDSFFVIGWSSAIRRLVYMEDKQLLENINDTTETKFWYKSSLIDTYATLNVMIVVQNLLDKMNIPYLNFFGWKSDFNLNNSSIEWLGKDYARVNKNGKIDFFKYKANMWSNAIVDNQVKDKRHEFNFINSLTKQLNIESFITKEFYNFLLEKGTKKRRFKFGEIPTINNEILVMSENDLHPNELGHELWTDEMLIPNIKRIINANTKHK